ncbi:MAG: tRNA pseudouridine(55) synthase TruB [Ruminococcus sp.]|nr:tRNA pseudouridine(55) synthase TruB [Ruminococcus sp.]
MYHGIINIYKEAGYTSHDVVAKLRGILRQKKIGHTGTLDPDAAGVLPVCLGVGTKLCDMLTDETKEYEAELCLGITTDTQDLSGTVLKEEKVTAAEEEVWKAVYSFLGDYEQIPPMYSALKVNGKKLYELARAGKEVERKARSVKIYELEILQTDLPVVRMRVVCSKGTYIRTLCDDIGRKLGCGGAMQSLLRTRVGSFAIKEALTLAEVEKYRLEGSLDAYIIPVDQMFLQLKEARIKDEYLKMLANGNCLFPKMLDMTGSFDEEQQLRIYDKEGVFYGIYRYEKEAETLYPMKMFLAGENGEK